MINLLTEKLVTFAQAARLRPPGRLGRPTHPSTVYRWYSRGVRGHHLEAIRLGATLYTSIEALQRFAERLTGDLAPPTSDDRDGQASAAAEALDEMGY